MSYNYKSQEYYYKFLELQEKLRKSEEERLNLEIKFNEMVQNGKEEEQQYYKRLKHQYKHYVESDRYRMQRNEQILQALERIEMKISMLSAKTERFKLLRHQYQTFLDRVHCNKPQDMKNHTHLSTDASKGYSRNTYVNDVNSDFLPTNLGSDHNSMNSVTNPSRIYAQDDIDKRPQGMPYSYPSNYSYRLTNNIPPLHSFTQDYDKTYSPRNMNMAEYFGYQEDLKKVKDAQNASRYRANKYTPFEESGLYLSTNYPNEKLNPETYDIPQSINGTSLGSHIEKTLDNISYERSPDENKRAVINIHAHSDPPLADEAGDHRFIQTANIPEYLQDSGNKISRTDEPQNYSLPNSNKLNEEGRISGGINKETAQEYLCDPIQRTEALTNVSEQPITEEQVNTPLLRDFVAIEGYNNEIGRSVITDSSTKNEPVQKVLEESNEYDVEPVEYEEDVLGKTVISHEDEQETNDISKRQEGQLLCDETQIVGHENQLDQNNIRIRRSIDAIDLSPKKHQTVNQPEEEKMNEVPIVAQEKPNENDLNVSCESQVPVIENVDCNEGISELQSNSNDETLLNKNISSGIVPSINEYEASSNIEPLMNDSINDPLHSDDNLLNGAKGEIVTNIETSLENLQIQNANYQESYVTDPNQLSQKNSSESHQNSQQNNEQNPEESVEKHEDIEELTMKRFRKHSKSQPSQQYDQNAQNYKQSTQYPGYDQNGQPISYDQNGQPIHYDQNGQPVTYDQNGQPIYQDPNTQPIHYQYDEKGQPYAQQYDDKGQPYMQYDEKGQPYMQYDASAQQYSQQYYENDPNYANYGEEDQQRYDDQQPYDDQQQYSQYNAEGYQHPQQSNYDDSQEQQPQQQQQQPYDQNAEYGAYYTEVQYNQNAFYQGDTTEELQQNPQTEENGKDDNKTKLMNMLETDTENSSKLDNKVSNDSDFDFSTNQ